MRKRQKKNSLKKRTKDHSKHRTAAAAVLGADGCVSKDPGVRRMVFGNHIPFSCQYGREDHGDSTVFRGGALPVPASGSAGCVDRVLCRKDREGRKGGERAVLLVFRSDPGSGNSGISLYCRMRDQLSQAQFFGGGRDRDVFLQL